MKSETYEGLAATLEIAIDAHVDYETGHEDAGSNYSHLPREGGWVYNNGPERLLKWCRTNGVEITPEEIEALEDEVLDWCDIEPGHMFSNPEMEGKFVVDSYPVGEVEDQYCIGDLSALLGVEEAEALEFVAIAMEDRRFCLRPNGDGGILSYTNTDACWNLVIDKAWVADRLEGIRELV